MHLYTHACIYLYIHISIYMYAFSFIGAELAAGAAPLLAGAAASCRRPAPLRRPACRRGRASAACRRCRGAGSGPCRPVGLVML